MDVELVVLEDEEEDVVAATEVVDEEGEDVEAVDEDDDVEAELVEIDNEDIVSEDCELLSEEVDKLSIDELDVVEAEVDCAVTLYSESPFGPPQTCALSAAQGILQRPSLTSVEPAARLLPQ